LGEHGLTAVHQRPSPLDGKQATPSSQISARAPINQGILQRTRRNKQLSAKELAWVSVVSANQCPDAEIRRKN
jgi:hypothetical protein